MIAPRNSSGRMVIALVGCKVAVGDNLAVELGEGVFASEDCVRAGWSGVWGTTGKIWPQAVDNSERTSSAEQNRSQAIEAPVFNGDRDKELG
jgi:hypothetical protein